MNGVFHYQINPPSLSNSTSSDHSRYGTIDENTPMTDSCPVTVGQQVSVPLIDIPPGLSQPRREGRTKCWQCGQDPPDHPGRNCPLNPERLAKASGRGLQARPSKGQHMWIRLQCQTCRTFMPEFVASWHNWRSQTCVLCYNRYFQRSISIQQRMAHSQWTTSEEFAQHKRLNQDCPMIVLIDMGFITIERKAYCCVL